MRATRRRLLGAPADSRGAAHALGAAVVADRELDPVGAAPAAAGERAREFARDPRGLALARRALDVLGPAVGDRGRVDRVERRLEVRLAGDVVAVCALGAVGDAHPGRYAVR